VKIIFGETKESFHYIPSRKFCFRDFLCHLILGCCTPEHSGVMRMNGLSLHCVWTRMLNMDLLLEPFKVLKSKVPFKINITPTIVHYWASLRRSPFIGSLQWHQCRSNGKIGYLQKHKTQQMLGFEINLSDSYMAAN
jgi:hypothetical protein